MSVKKEFEASMKPEKKTIRGKCRGGAAFLLALVIFGCSGGGEKSAPGKSEQKTLPHQEKVAQETVAQETVNPTATAPPALPTKMPVVKEARQPEPPPSLGMSPEEFRLRFNKTSELVKSKLRIKKLNMVAGERHETFKNIFNENLYLTGEVNRGDGSLAEVNFAGVLNGSLATTVDLNVCFGTVITAFSPRLSPSQRDAILYDLGITNKDVDIYSLDKKVTKKGITYWVKSSRADGIRFGARSAAGK